MNVNALLSHVKENLVRKEIFILLRERSVEHKSKAVGLLTSYILLKSCHSRTSSKLNFSFSVRPRSEIDGQKYRIESHLNIDLECFDSLEDLQRYVFIEVTTILVYQAGSKNQLTPEFKHIFNTWDYSNGLFVYKAFHLFHVVDLSKEVARLINSELEVYFNQHYSK